MNEQNSSLPFAVTDELPLNFTYELVDLLKCQEVEGCEQGPLGQTV